MDIAAGQPARPLPAEDREEEWIGRTVSLAPSDYGKDPVKGVLVANLASRWILQRRVNGLSTVNVHFPKQGFTLMPA